VIVSADDIPPPAEPYTSALIPAIDAADIMPYRAAPCQTGADIRTADTSTGPARQSS